MKLVVKRKVARYGRYNAVWCPANCIVVPLPDTLKQMHLIGLLIWSSFCCDFDSTSVQFVTGVSEMRIVLSADVAQHNKRPKTSPKSLWKSKIFLIYWSSCKYCGVTQSCIRVKSVKIRSRISVFVFGQNSDYRTMDYNYACSILWVWKSVSDIEKRIYAEGLLE
jgi:hypothetical protein